MTLVGMPKARYEFKPFKHSSHEVVLNILAGEKRVLRILDVGTASGYLGKALRERGHYVAGIEGDPLVAERARAHYDFFQVANIETLNFLS